MKQIELVTWVDSESYNGWRPVKEALTSCKEADLRCCSVGFVMYEDKEKLTVVTSMTKDEGAVHTSMSIPKCAVVSRQVLKVRRQP